MTHREDAGNHGLAAAAGVGRLRKPRGVNLLEEVTHRAQTQRLEEVFRLVGARQIRRRASFETHLRSRRSRSLESAMNGSGNRVEDVGGLFRPDRKRPGGHESRPGSHSGVSAHARPVRLRAVRVNGRVGVLSVLRESHEADPIDGESGGMSPSAFRKLLSSLLGSGVAGDASRTRGLIRSAPVGARRARRPVSRAGLSLSWLPARE